MKHLFTDALLDRGHTLAASFFSGSESPWEVLDGLADRIVALGETLPPEEYDRVADNVWIAKDASVAETACVIGPCIVDHGAEIRHCAFLRGGVIVGKNCVVGNSTEVKNAVLFDCVQIPHYNYVGDSLLGYRSHLGAGSVCSNVKSDKTPVTVSDNGRKIPTGRKKFGAVVGDFAEIGCNSVLCPGTVIGRNSTVYPLSRVRGYLPPHRILKDASTSVEKMKRKD